MSSIVVNPDRVITSRCAFCRVQRQDANHWFMVRIIGARPEMKDSGGSYRGQLEVIDWKPELADLDYRSCCGEEHLHFLIARWISSGTFEEGK